MKRSQRIGAIIKELSDKPNTPISLQYFCDKYDAAKSSISEDIKEANEALIASKTGHLETISGKNGGVRYIPDISNEEILEFQKEFSNKLSDPARLLGGNFIYTSDIFYDPSIVTKLACIFIKKFIHLNADYVVTVETKGIPLAFSVARGLGLPLIVIRRDAKISEGSTVSINYFSGSDGRLMKMTMSKRAIKPNSKVIIIDDFMRAGGSIVGITEMIKEFDSEVIGVGVAIVSLLPEKKVINNYTCISYIGNISTELKEIEVINNLDII